MVVVFPNARLWNEDLILGEWRKGPSKNGELGGFDIFGVQTCHNKMGF